MKKIAHWIKNLFSHRKPSNGIEHPPVYTNNKETVDYINEKLSSMNNEEGYKFLKGQ